MTNTEARERAASSPLTLLAGVLVALGLVRVASRALGLVVLTGVVLATVALLTVGVLVLRAALG